VTAGKSRLPGIWLLFFAGILGWWIPGAGHWLIGQRKRAALIFISLVFAFTFGIYIGSIAVVDAPESWYIAKLIYSLISHKQVISVSGSPWYFAQILFSPAVGYLAHLSAAFHLDSYGRPREIGEIYTGIAGMLNLLCVVNAVYMAHCINIKERNK